MIRVNLISSRVEGARPILPSEWMLPQMKEKKDAKFKSCPITGNPTLRRQSKDQEEGEGDESLYLFGNPGSVIHRTDDTAACDTIRPALPPPQAYSLQIIDGIVRNRVSARVLDRLAEAEAGEPDAWLRDDIRIAWICVLHCADGIADPWRFAFWKYLGQVPEKLIPVFVERAEKHRLMNLPDYDPTLKKLPSPSAPPRKRVRNA